MRFSTHTYLLLPGGEVSILLILGRRKKGWKACWLMKLEQEDEEVAVCFIGKEVICQE